MAEGRAGVRTVARWALAGLMGVAGIGHLVATDEFLGQTPAFLPQRELIVVVSGVVEIGFALALVLLPRYRRQVGWALAAFFVLVFPGNLYQAIEGTSTFALDEPVERWVRLLFQPVLVLWALWSTGAWPRVLMRARSRGGNPRAPG
jgi:uncharacterized membrane protein